MASKFNDDGINHLFELLLEKIEAKTKTVFGSYHFGETAKVSQAIIPSNRTRYLSEISENNRNYDQLVKDQSTIATKLYQLHGSLEIFKQSESKVSPPVSGGDPIAIGLEEALQRQITFLTDQLT